MCIKLKEILTRDSKITNNKSKLEETNYKSEQNIPMQIKNQSTSDISSLVETRFEFK